MEFRPTDSQEFKDMVLKEEQDNNDAIERTMANPRVKNLMLKLGILDGRDKTGIALFKKEEASKHSWFWRFFNETELTPLEKLEADKVKINDLIDTWNKYNPDDLISKKPHLFEDKNCECPHCKFYSDIKTKYFGNGSNSSQH